jgi:hypothetical protein
MSRGPGSWQRAALALLDKEMQFREIAEQLGAVSWSQRSALRRALDRLAAAGRFGKRPRTATPSGQTNVLWFPLK